MLQGHKPRYLTPEEKAEKTKDWPKGFKTLEEINKIAQERAWRSRNWPTPAPSYEDEPQLKFII